MSGRLPGAVVRPCSAAHVAFPFPTPPRDPRPRVRCAGACDARPRTCVLQSMVPDSAAMQSAAMQATRHARRIYVGGIGNVDEKVRAPPPPPRICGVVYPPIVVAPPPNATCGRDDTDGTYYDDDFTHHLLLILSRSPPFPPRRRWCPCAGARAPVGCMGRFFCVAVHGGVWALRCCSRAPLLHAGHHGVLQ